MSQSLSSASWLDMVPGFELVDHNVVVDADDDAEDPLLGDTCNCVPRWKATICTDDRCINYAMQVECTRCRSTCGNNRFQKGICADLEVLTTEEKGLGLFAKNDIKKNAFIAEYLGELINHTTLQRRNDIHTAKRAQAIAQQRSQGGAKHQYVMQLKDNSFLDARSKGSIGRFINHSCEPNCRTEVWTVKGKLRAGIFATSHIPAGTELSFDYEWELSEDRPPTKCLCGTPSCRGYIEVIPQGVRGQDEPSSLQVFKKGVWRTGNKPLDTLHRTTTTMRKVTMDGNDTKITAQLHRAKVGILNLRQPLAVVAPAFSAAAVADDSSAESKTTPADHHTDTSFEKELAVESPFPLSSTTFSDNSVSSLMATYAPARAAPEKEQTSHRALSFPLPQFPPPPPPPPPPPIPPLLPVVAPLSDPQLPALSLSASPAASATASCILNPSSATSLLLLPPATAPPPAAAAAGAIKEEKGQEGPLMTAKDSIAPTPSLLVEGISQQIDGVFSAANADVDAASSSIGAGTADALSLAAEVDASIDVRDQQTGRLIPERLIFKRVKIYWKGNMEYLEADVLSYNKRTGKYLVRYLLDGEEQDEDLADPSSIWQWLDVSQAETAIRKKEKLENSAVYAELESDADDASKRSGSKSARKALRPISAVVESHSSLLSSQLLLQQQQQQQQMMMLRAEKEENMSVRVRFEVVSAIVRKGDPLFYEECRAAFAVHVSASTSSFSSSLAAIDVFTTSDGTTNIVSAIKEPISNASSGRNIPTRQYQQQHIVSESASEGWNAEANHYSFSYTNAHPTQPIMDYNDVGYRYTSGAYNAGGYMPPPSYGYPSCDYAYRGYLPQQDPWYNDSLRYHEQAPRHGHNVRPTFAAVPAPPATPPAPRAAKPPLTGSLAKTAAEIDFRTKIWQRFVTYMQSEFQLYTPSLTPPPFVPPFSKAGARHQQKSQQQLKSAISSYATRVSLPAGSAALLRSSGASDALLVNERDILRPELYSLQTLVLNMSGKSRNVRKASDHLAVSAREFEFKLAVARIRSVQNTLNLQSLVLTNDWRVTPVEIKACKDIFRAAMSYSPLTNSSVSSNVASANANGSNTTGTPDGVALGGSNEGPHSFSSMGDYPPPLPPPPPPPPLPTPPPAPASALAVAVAAATRRGSEVELKEAMRPLTEEVKSILAAFLASRGVPLSYFFCLSSALSTSSGGGGVSTAVASSASTSGSAGGGSLALLSNAGSVALSMESAVLSTLHFLCEHPHLCGKLARQENVPFFFAPDRTVLSSTQSTESDEDGITSPRARKTIQAAMEVLAASQASTQLSENVRSTAIRHLLNLVTIRLNFCESASVHAMILLLRYLVVSCATDSIISEMTALIAALAFISAKVSRIVPKGNSRKFLKRIVNMAYCQVFSRSESEDIFGTRSNSNNVYTSSSTGMMSSSGTNSGNSSSSSGSNGMLFIQRTLQKEAQILYLMHGDVFVPDVCGTMIGFVPAAAYELAQFAASRSSRDQQAPYRHSRARAVGPHKGYPSVQALIHDGQQAYLLLLTHYPTLLVAFSPDIAQLGCSLALEAMHCLLGALPLSTFTAEASVASSPISDEPSTLFKALALLFIRLTALDARISAAAGVASRGTGIPRRTGATVEDGVVRVGERGAAVGSGSRKRSSAEDEAARAEALMHDVVLLWMQLLAPLLPSTIPFAGGACDARYSSTKGNAGFNDGGKCGSSSNHMGFFNIWHDDCFDESAVSSPAPPRRNVRGLFLPYSDQTSGVKAGLTSFFVSRVLDYVRSALPNWVASVPIFEILLRREQRSTSSSSSSHASRVYPSRSISSSRAEGFSRMHGSEVDSPLREGEHNPHWNDPSEALAKELVQEYEKDEMKELEQDETGVYLSNADSLKTRCHWLTPQDRVTTDASSVLLRVLKDPSQYRIFATGTAFSPEPRTDSSTSSARDVAGSTSSIAGSWSGLRDGSSGVRAVNGSIGTFSPSLEGIVDALPVKMRLVGKDALVLSVDRALLKDFCAAEVAVRHLDSTKNYKNKLIPDGYGTNFDNDNAEEASAVPLTLHAWPPNKQLFRELKQLGSMDGAHTQIDAAALGFSAFAMRELTILQHLHYFKSNFTQGSSRVRNESLSISGEERKNGEGRRGREREGGSKNARREGVSSSSSVASERSSTSTIAANTRRGSNNGRSRYPADIDMNDRDAELDERDASHSIILEPISLLELSGFALHALIIKGALATDAAAAAAPDHRSIVSSHIQEGRAADGGARLPAGAMLAQSMTLGGTFGYNNADDRSSANGYGVESTTAEHGGSDIKRQTGRGLSYHSHTRLDPADLKKEGLKALIPGVVIQESVGGALGGSGLLPATSAEKLFLEGKELINLTFRFMVASSQPALSLTAFIALHSSSAAAADAVAGTDSIDRNTIHGNSGNKSSNNGSGSKGKEGMSRGRGRGVSPFLSIELCRDLLLAVDHMHSCGVFLRWLSTDQIYVTAEGRLLIAGMEGAVLADRHNCAHINTQLLEADGGISTAATDDAAALNSRDGTGSKEGKDGNERKSSRFGDSSKRGREEEDEGRLNGAVSSNKHPLDPRTRRPPTAPITQAAAGSDSSTPHRAKKSRKDEHETPAASSSVDKRSRDERHKERKGTDRRSDKHRERDRDEQRERKISDGSKDQKHRDRGASSSRGHKHAPRESSAVGSTSGDDHNDRDAADADLKNRKAEETMRPVPASCLMLAAPEVLLGAKGSVESSIYTALSLAVLILTGRSIVKNASSEAKQLQYLYKTLGTPSSVGCLSFYASLPESSDMGLHIHTEDGLKIESRNRLHKVLASLFSPALLQHFSRPASSSATAVAAANTATARSKGSAIPESREPSAIRHQSGKTNNTQENASNSNSSSSSNCAGIGIGNGRGNVFGEKRSAGGIGEGGAISKDSRANNNINNNSSSSNNSGLQKQQQQQDGGGVCDFLTACLQLDPAARCISVRALLSMPFFRHMCRLCGDEVDRDDKAGRGGSQRSDGRLSARSFGSLDAGLSFTEREVSLCSDLSMADPIVVRALKPESRVKLVRDLIGSG